MSFKAKQSQRKFVHLSFDPYTSVCIHLVIGLLHRVNEGSASEVIAASIFSVEIFKLG
jgi:hypothetical protein